MKGFFWVTVGFVALSALSWLAALAAAIHFIYKYW